MVTRSHLHVGIARSWGERGWIVKKHKETFVGDVNILRPDCSSGFTMYTIVKTHQIVYLE